MVNLLSGRRLPMEMFESDVIPDSGKSLLMFNLQTNEFESDVIPDSGKSKCV